MKNKTKDESWRSRYIRLLMSPLDRIEGSTEDLQAFEDLVDAGFMRGTMVHDSVGDVAAGSIRGVTLHGNLFAEEQMKIIMAESIWGRIKSGVGLSVGWLSGVLSAVIVYYLTKEG
jgi:hypothetical protein